MFKCYRVLLCLLTFGLIKSSDQCDFDHFKVQIVFKIASTWGGGWGLSKNVTNNQNEM